MKDSFPGVKRGSSQVQRNNALGQDFVFFVVESARARYCQACPAALSDKKKS